MKVFAISDLHLSINSPKPMDIFGPVWEGYLDKIFAQWREKVGEEDLVLIAGDFSWAMKLESAEADFRLLQELPGKKVIIRGNHDYWWKSISAVREMLPSGFYAIQNDSLKFGNVIVCGTRGWLLDDKGLSEEDEKIYNREVLRLGMTLESAKKKQEEGEKLICMMHYPPVNNNLEDSAFSKLIDDAGVDYVVFGHLHAHRTMSLTFSKGKTNYFLTSCDLTDNNLTFICEV